MEQAAFPSDTLPPKGTYESRESLVAAINTWAKPRGYAFTTGKSLKTANGRVRVILACDRNKPPPSASTERVRRTTSRRTGCKFSVLAKQSRDGTTWALTHRPDGECARHNHPPSEDPSAHPAHRRLTEQDAATISSLALSGTAPRDIRTYVHNHSDTLATQRDIYNRIAATRRDLREGQSSIEALVDQLYSEGFWCRVKLDSDNRLTAIFFAHPDSVAYLQCNPDVLLLDCTYKTNKYEMPLLDMVGVDSCQRSFCIAFAFLSGESAEDYSWALQHLRTLYQRDLPSVILTDRCIAAMNAAAIWFASAKALLCLWHVNKAVLQRCRPFFTPKGDHAAPDQTGDDSWNEFYGFWHSIVASPNESIFEERLTKFELKYGNKYLDAVGYIKMYWLDPYKEKIVKACVCAPYKHAITNQLKELKHVRVSQQIRLPLDVSGVLFEAVRGWVSHHALRKVQEQRQLYQKPNRMPCSQTFTSSHGLPCSHTLKKLEDEKRALSLEHFHPHWHEVQPLPILEPRRAIDRLSLRRIQPATSTRREPSGFELVEGSKRAPRKCSRCHAPGHIKTSRHCPLRGKESPKPAVQVPGPFEQSSTTTGPALEPVSTSTTEAASMTSDEPLCETLMNVTAPTPHDRCIPPLPQAPDGVSSAATPGHSTDAIRESASEERIGEEVSCSCETLRTSPRYDSPETIHRRYVAARGAWYAAQPAGSVKTNQQYRSAMGLPQRYDKQSYEWCLDYKQMSKRCITSTGSRNWTKEEMMAYLDWSKAEDERIEAQVAKEMGDNPLANKRKGLTEIWQRVEEDSREQVLLHSEDDNADRCIFVKM
ncbi:hypothetical protein HIM_10674 [Hirsutella minnesotensis 3608]|uniref:MULE transposase domain-containing protein n=1 Tax=Hirsutella minnesotensis 3608 TaxID=1043627 RepID=A0A0F7ZFY2_9HYPO|nr:hypothetical protein HIM_10674 [Hirsutella minnesotensis 3608]